MNQAKGLDGLLGERSNTGLGRVPAGSLGTTRCVACGLLLETVGELNDAGYCAWCQANLEGACALDGEAMRLLTGWVETRAASRNVTRQEVEEAIKVATNEALKAFDAFDKRGSPA